MEGVKDQTICSSSPRAAAMLRIMCLTFGFHSKRMKTAAQMMLIRSSVLQKDSCRDGSTEVGFSPVETWYDYAVIKRTPANPMCMKYRNLLWKKINIQAGDFPTHCMTGNKYFVAKCCCTAEYIWPKIPFSADSWVMMAVTFLWLTIKWEYLIWIDRDQGLNSQLI